MTPEIEKRIQELKEKGRRSDGESFDYTDWEALARHVETLLIDRAIEEIEEMICDCDPSGYRKNPCKSCRRLAELKAQRQAIQEGR